MELGEIITTIFGTYDTAPVAGALETIFQPLITDKTVKQIRIGDKHEGKLKFPYIGVQIGDIIQDESKSSIGNSEFWNIQAQVKAIVEDPKHPIRGQATAIGIINEIKSLVLEDRSLGYPEVIRDVESSKFVVMPYSMYLTDEKTGLKQYYGCGIIFRIMVIARN